MMIGGGFGGGLMGFGRKSKDQRIEESYKEKEKERIFQANSDFYARRDARSTALELADRNNAAQREQTGMQGQAQRDVADISGKSGVQREQIGADANRDVAGINGQFSVQREQVGADAQVRGHQIAAGASNYAADQAKSGAAARSLFEGYMQQDIARNKPAVGGRLNLTDEASVRARRANKQLDIGAFDDGEGGIDYEAYQRMATPQSGPLGVPGSGAGADPREALRGILTSEGPANQSMVDRIKGRVSNKMQPSHINSLAPDAGYGTTTDGSEPPAPTGPPADLIRWR